MYQIDFNFIFRRNVEEIQKFITDYKMTRNIKELMTKFERLHFQHDVKNQRLRLIGIEQQIEEDFYEDANGNKINAPERDPNYKHKTKRIQLYVLKKKYYQNMDDSEKEEIALQLNYFISLFNQLKRLREVMLIEDNEISFYKQFYDNKSV